MIREVRADQPSFHDATWAPGSICVEIYSKDPVLGLLSVRNPQKLLETANIA